MNVGKRVVVAGLGIACALVVGGCGVVGTGVRVAEGGEEGAASAAPEPPGAAGEGEALSVDPVEVLREDAGVRRDVKDLIARPCVGEGYADGWFPLYTRYATLAGTDVPVVIINVQGCADVVACSGAYASYVYRLWEDRVERVYASEETMSEVAAVGGELFVQWPVWRPNDPRDCPSDSESVPLVWDGDGLRVEDE